MTNNNGGILGDLQRYIGTMSRKRRRSSSKSLSRRSASSRSASGSAESRGSVRATNLTNYRGKSVKAIIEMDFYKEFVEFADQLSPAERKGLERDLGAVPILGLTQKQLTRMILYEPAKYKEFMEAMVRWPAGQKLYENIVMKTTHLRLIASAQRGGKGRSHKAMRRGMSMLIKRNSK